MSEWVCHKVTAFFTKNNYINVTEFYVIRIKHTHAHAQNVISRCTSQILSSNNISCSNSCFRDSWLLCPKKPLPRFASLPIVLLYSASHLSEQAVVVVQYDQLCIVGNGSFSNYFITYTIENFKLFSTSTFSFLLC